MKKPVKPVPKVKGYTATIDMTLGERTIFIGKVKKRGLKVGKVIADLIRGWK